MPELSAIVEALLKPQGYPETTQTVELRQTQMSFLFLTDRFVYKIEKPVNLGYLDYTTLEKRLVLCRKEVELNRRLCPDTYLGVVPVTQQGNSFQFQGEGDFIEYAVKMRRLPQEMMMDQLIKQNRLTPEMIDKVARKMTAFHQKAATSEYISSFGNLQTIIRNADENFTQTEKYIGKTISQPTYDLIKNYTENFIDEHSGLFQKRVEGDKIRDCHGDLHAAHICFTDGICIYDCIEFNDRFRYCDVAAEISFLAMDLDHYDKFDLSKRFVNTYVAQSYDEELLMLSKYYKCYFAYVRGKVESFKLDDKFIPDEEKKNIISVAQSYFKLAVSYI